MKKSAQKDKPKKTKKQLAFQIVLIVVIAVAGVASGFYCGNLYLSTKHKKVDYSKFSEKDLLPNFKEVLERNSGKSLSEVSPVDAFVIAQYKLENSEHFIATSNDSLTHNYGKQNVYTYKHKLNGVILTKEITTSKMISLAKKFKVEDGKVYLYNGDPTSSTEASWLDNFSTYTPEEFKNVVGLNAYTAVPYIVSEKTVSSEDKNAFVAGSGTRLNNGGFRFTLSLDTSSSVINYVKKIKYMSGLSDYPTFSTLNLTFDIDKDFNFINITTSEVYSFKYMGGIFVTCSGNISTNYDFKTVPSEI